MKNILFLLLVFSMYACTSSSQNSTKTVSPNSSSTPAINSPKNIEDLFSAFKETINNKNKTALQALFIEHEDMKNFDAFVKDAFDTKHRTQLDSLQLSSLEKVNKESYDYQYLHEDIESAYLLKIHSNNMTDGPTPPTWFCYFVIINNKPSVLLRKITICG